MPQGKPKAGKRRKLPQPWLYKCHGCERSFTVQTLHSHQRVTPNESCRNAQATKEANPEYPGTEEQRARNVPASSISPLPKTPRRKIPEAPPTPSPKTKRGEAKPGSLVDELLDWFGIEDE